MKDWPARQMRYQRDSLSLQLGGLASNLGRIAWCAERNARQQILPVFQESKYFTEWAAEASSLEQQAMLAELQLELALWERGWGGRLPPSRIAQDAQRWSVRLLQSAGLMSE